MIQDWTDIESAYLFGNTLAYSLIFYKGRKFQNLNCDNNRTNPKHYYNL